MDYKTILSIFLLDYNKQKKTSLVLTSAQIKIGDEDLLPILSMVHTSHHFF